MVLTLTDDLTIQHIVRLKQLLQQSLAETDQLVIDLTGAAAVDAAGLQLLYAVRAEASRLQKKCSLRIADDSASSFHRACHDLGLERLCTE